jgi:hypothetical protein
VFMKNARLTLSAAALTLVAVATVGAGSVSASTIDLTDGVVINASDEPGLCVSASVNSNANFPDCDLAAWDEARGYGLDVQDYDNLMTYLGGNPDTPITINGAIEDVRGLLTKLGAPTGNTTVDAANAALIAALGAVPSLTLTVDGDTEIIPNDLGYITYLTNLAENEGQALIVNVDGNVTFGAAIAGGGFTGDETIADVSKAGMRISATGTITVPDGYGAGITEFLGESVISAGNTVVSDGVTYTAAEDNVFAVVAEDDDENGGIGLPETGFLRHEADGGTMDGQLAAIAAGAATVTISAAVLLKKRKAEIKQ